MARADKPLLHVLETRGLLHTPCRAARKDLELEGLSRQARTRYIPLVTVYVACVAPALLQAFGFDPLPNNSK